MRLSGTGSLDSDSFTARAVCVHALIARGILTRFSGGLRGYIWVILTPVTWILAIAVFFVFLGRSAPIHVNLPAFLATGMLPYLIFRQTITAMMRAEAQSRHVLVARMASTEQVFAATALLEAINAIFLTIIVLGAVAIVFGLPRVENPLLAGLALSLAWLLGAALGRLLAELCKIMPDTARTAPILLRPFFWISGIFFLAQELPPIIGSWLWWNPLLHIVEMSRDGFFINHSSRFVALEIPLIAIVALGAGAMFLATRPARIVTS